MTHVAIQPQAASDLLRIAEHLSLQSDSGEIGDRFLQVASETASLLARTPLIGRARPSRNAHLQGLRSLALKRPFHRYVFYYQTNENGVLVLRALHAAQSASYLLSLEPE